MAEYFKTGLEQVYNLLLRSTHDSSLSEEEFEKLIVEFKTLARKEWERRHGKKSTG